ncbi:MAG: lysophospholipid acyltransferase family protein [Desulfobulbaceae bacterium]|jgi:lysophospholipid acyltransferase (LPLAT)-like uncharacterized protein|nr:lysophospholipid acyltransferase family protein [Desulfobulbaceae bacterium]
MALKINKLLSSKLAQWVLYKFIRIYSLTFRLEIQNEKAWLDDYLQNNSSIILCVHHQQFFPAIRYFQRYRKYNPGLMISQSKDGDFIAAVANRTGWVTVRGSSSHGGQEALKGMIAHLAEHRLASHIIDGPRGPFGVVKPGVIRLAHATGSAIVPFYTGADKAWYARSWDRFLLPKPFSRVVLRFGEKIKFKQTETSEAFEEQRKSLEDIMFKDNEKLKTDLAVRSFPAR